MTRRLHGSGDKGYEISVSMSDPEQKGSKPFPLLGFKRPVQVERIVNSFGRRQNRSVYSGEPTRASQMGMRSKRLP